MFLMMASSTPSYELCPSFSMPWSPEARFMPIDFAIFALAVQQRKRLLLLPGF